MTSAATTERIGITASDVSGQKVATVRDIPNDATVGDLIQGLLHSVNLPKNDPSGRPVAYHARLEREGRHLHDSEMVIEALKPDDHIVLHPNVDAGATPSTRT
jgi:hypothetical protein